MNFALNRLGMKLARYLAAPREVPDVTAPVDLARLCECLQPADVLLIEGHSRFSTGIKYLTQSTWSHAALYVGNTASIDLNGEITEDTPSVVEADVVEGVRLVSLKEYAGMHVRVCRAVSLTPDEQVAVVNYALDRLGHHYDMKNILDLVRWLLPTPPIPERFRRRLIQLGSGDPTRAICSTLVAQAFQSVRYPILPVLEHQPVNDAMSDEQMQPILRMRHHSLFVPKDFDVSPYFEVIKPTLTKGFDHHLLELSPPSDAEPLPNS